MGVIKIHVCKSKSGEVVSTNVPDDIPIPEVLQILDSRHEIGIKGKPEQFVLYNISQQFEYHPTDTLAGRSTADGDLSIVVDTSFCTPEAIIPK
ncbi:MAG: hypothetical protein ABSB78_08975 [Bacteroidota bacterium]